MSEPQARPKLNTLYVWGDDVAISDLKVGDNIERGQRISDRLGPISGEIIKVNPVTIEFKTYYGGWAGRPPDRMYLKVRKDDLEGVCVARGTTVSRLVIP